MIVVPEMIGSVIGVYSGQEFNQVEIKPEMVGHYLAEFSISSRPVKQVRPVFGATNSSVFIHLNKTTGLWLHGFFRGADNVLDDLQRIQVLGAFTLEGYDVYKRRRRAWEMV